MFKRCRHLWAFDSLVDSWLGKWRDMVENMAVSLKRRGTHGKVEKYFQSALSDFMFELSCGGAIHHLADLGYTARQITDNLSFPVPYERVRKEFTRYLLEKRVLLRQEPKEETCALKVTYVQEYGKYGKPSFRRVETREEPAEGREKIYVPCDFGLFPELFEEQLKALEMRQQEYLLGICWERRRMYHLLDKRMQEIILRLSDADEKSRL